VVPFDVPAEVEPTLIAQPRSPGEQPEFLVQGVAGVIYHVYQSSDLTSWELVETHLDAPFTFTPPADTPSAGFFQTRIEPVP
jgi:hypothetical protein